MMRDIAKTPAILVTSGKGGTGKTLISANLALKLSEINKRVGLIDCDLRAPNLTYIMNVYDKKLERYAGSTRFYDIQLQNKTLQLGYTWYGENFHGTGLNKHCKYLLLEFAFEKMNMIRVEFRADKDTLHSIAAMKSIGCKVDGILRSNMIKLDGSRRDSIVLSILQEEWFESVKENLKTKLL